MVVLDVKCWCNPSVRHPATIDPSDALLRCLRISIPPTRPQVQIKRPKRTIRLKSGANHGEGRVEVFINNYWGTVCSEDWDLVDASVACRHLGFGVAKELIPNAGFGQGKSPLQALGASFGQVLSKHSCCAC